MTVTALRTLPTWPEVNVSLTGPYSQSQRGADDALLLLGSLGRP